MTTAAGSGWTPSTVSCSWTSLPWLGWGRPTTNPTTLISISRNRYHMEDNFLYRQGQGLQKSISYSDYNFQTSVQFCSPKTNKSSPVHSVYCKIPWLVLQGFNWKVWLTDHGLLFLELLSQLKQGLLTSSCECACNWSMCMSKCDVSDRLSEQPP